MNLGMIKHPPMRITLTLTVLLLCGVLTCSAQRNVKDSLQYYNNRLTLRFSTLDYGTSDTVNPGFSSIASLVQNDRSAHLISGDLGYQAGVGIDWIVHSITGTGLRSWDLNGSHGYRYRSQVFSLCTSL